MSEVIERGTDTRNDVVGCQVKNVPLSYPTGETNMLVLAVMDRYCSWARVKSSRPHVVTGRDGLNTFKPPYCGIVTWVLTTNI